MASLFGIDAIKRGLLLLAAAAFLLSAMMSIATSTLAQSTRPADKPAPKQGQKQDQKQEQSGKSDKAGKSSKSTSQSTVTRPRGRVSGTGTRRAPDAGEPDATPPLGQIPSIAGGISQMNAAGFAPNAPVFEGLQPELPEAGPLPVGPGQGRGIGRGSGIGEGDDSTGDGDNGDNGGNDDEDDEGRGFGKTVQDCVENASGVTVWRGSCDD